ncbi:MAG: CARDB domain-containing protein [Acidimicrobiales bacterium]
MSKKLITLVVSLMVAATALVSAAPSGAVDVGAVDGPEDFRQIAGGGFTFGVPGNEVDGWTGYPGTVDNNYTWSGAYLDPDGPGGDPGFLLMGTLQNSFDFSIPFAERSAEIWRYDFSESDPLGGTWTKAWSSGVILEELFPTPECVGLRGAVVTDIGDGVPKAVFSCVGGRGKLIYTTDGVNFSDMSTRGLPLSYIGFREIAAVDHDENGRDDALYISPVATFETADDGVVIRSDLSPDPVMLVNTNPLGNGRWRVASEPGFGDPDNIGVFAMAGIDTNGNGTDDAVLAIASNRASGAQGWVSLGGCRGGILGTIDRLTGRCVAQWEQVMDKGAGLPLTTVGGEQRSTNAFASDIAQVGDTVYVTLGETVSPGNDGGAASTELASIVVSGCPGVAVAAAGGAVGADACSWSVNNVMGNARPLSAASDVLNFDCVADREWCIPTSGLVASFGEQGTVGSSDWDALEPGEPFYLWRAESDGNEVWMTTAGGGPGGGPGIPGAFGGGYQTWRIDPTDDALTLIDDTGFNPLNIGGRTLVYAEPLGMVTGTSVFDTGGNVYVAGCHPGDPFPNAGGDPSPDFDQIVFDVVQDADGTSDAADDDQVDVVVDASTSLGAPCDDLVEIEIYSGANCTGSSLLGVNSTADTVPDDAVYLDADVSTGSSFTDVVYSIRAKGESGAEACRDHVVRASTNLPPSAEVTGSTLAGEACSIFGCSQIAVDPEADDIGSFDITAQCVDPESLTPLTCTWTSEWAGQGVSPSPVLFDGSETLAIAPGGQTVTVDLNGSAFELGDQCSGLTRSPLGCTLAVEIGLTAVDSLGFTTVNEFTVTLQPPFVGPAVRNSGFACGGVCISKAAGETDDPTVGVPIDMQVEVVNGGNVPASFGLSLSDSLGGTVAIGATSYNPPAGPFASLTAVPGFSAPVVVPFTWIPAAPGSAEITAAIPFVPGDNPTDNSGSRSFTVLASDPEFDAAVVSVVTDAPADSGVPQTVTVTVANNGDAAADFDVELFEGSMSGTQVDSTMTVTGLAAGDDTEVTFSWTPGAAGTAVLVALVSGLSTGTDELPANDTRSVPVAVVNPATETMHVRAMSGSASGLFFRTAQVTVQIADGTDAPVAGATVAMSFTRGSFPGGSGTTSCVTDGSGRCTVNVFVGIGASSSVFTVTGVTGSRVYVPSDNAEFLGDPATITIL